MNKKYKQGFTLIEVIIGMLLIGIAVSILSTFLIPLSEQNTSNVSRATAVEIASSLMDRIRIEPFDLTNFCLRGRSEHRCRLKRSIREPYKAMYPNFKFHIFTYYSSIESQIQSNQANYKIIQINITTPQGEILQLEAIKGNYTNV